MNSVTDPYQPLEKRYRLTRQCLEVFAQFDDLDLLVIQTRSPLVIDDLELIACIPYAFLSMTLETDRAALRPECGFDSGAPSGRPSGSGGRDSRSNRGLALFAL
jgi:DNA repair photolyase